MEDYDATNEKRKRMSCGWYVGCPTSLKEAMKTGYEFGFNFLVTQLTHPKLIAEVDGPDVQHVIGRTDRILKGDEWGQLIVGELSTDIDIECEDAIVRRENKEILVRELGFASHLGIPAVLIYLTKQRNVQLARIITDKLNSGCSYSIWVQIPMVHSSKNDPIGDDEQDTWDWWNDFRTYCDYDKRVGIVLELPDLKHIPSDDEIDRWVGEPVRALVIKSSYFLRNQYGKPVLPKLHQELIKRFMSLNVQYIVKIDSESPDPSSYVKYMHFLGKKLFVYDNSTEFVQGCEDFLQNPLQPLAEHLESTVYEVFEKDQVKYDYYQKAFHEAMEAWQESRPPVVMVVGAGRGPLVQAVLNVSKILNRKVEVYAVEKNPYAMNTLAHRNKFEWNLEVTLVKSDMRNWDAPVNADIMISELLGSFGDNELSPECLDGAQRFLSPDKGISIPAQYTSFIAPVQSLKLFNEVRNSRLPDKTLREGYETPYVVHLANFCQLAPPEPLFVFDHPNFPKDGREPDNTRYKSVKFPPTTKATVLTGFAGYFETVLYGNVILSTNPKRHTPDMVSWFPIFFPLATPVQLKAGEVVRVSFWREETHENVWYEWCLESPRKTPIMNAHGRSYKIKKL